MEVGVERKDLTTMTDHLGRFQLEVINHLADLQVKELAKRLALFDGWIFDRPSRGQETLDPGMHQIVRSAQIKRQARLPLRFSRSARSIKLVHDSRPQPLGGLWTGAGTTSKE